MTRLINKCGHLPFTVNHKRVCRIMREHGIRADYRCPKRQRQQAKQAYATANVLKRQFKQNEINHVWVTDTTEVSYGKQNYKVRLHGVLDLCGQYLVSYLVTPTETAEGAIAVFERAKQEVGMIAPLVHSDRDAAYISEAFNHYLMDNDVQHSYSALGTPADNAVMEHWWADFKSIWLNHQPPAQTLEELLKQIAEGVNYFNTKYISGKRNDLTAAEYRNRKAI